jgi:hypothetical protein
VWEGWGHVGLVMTFKFIGWCKLPTFFVAFFFFLGIVFDPEAISDMYLGNVVSFPEDYTASYPRSNTFMASSVTGSEF